MFTANVSAVIVLPPCALSEEGKPVYSD